MAANDMDAGCFAGMGLKDAEIKSIVSAGDTEMQIRELRLCRLRLLDEVHRKQQELDRLDYMIRQMQGK